MTYYNTVWGLGSFTKQDDVNPIMTTRDTVFFDCPIAGRVAWEATDIYNPGAITVNGQVCVFYRADDNVGEFSGTSRVGLATSDDGLHFTRRDTPVLFPDNDDFRQIEWEGGCEDPRVVAHPGGGYVMLYTGFNGTKGRLCVATSSDMLQWTKHGLAFGDAGNGKYHDYWSKAGAIVTKRDGDTLVATQIGGKYWMYFGESNIFTATSDDLIHWTPVEIAFGDNKWFTGHEGAKYFPERSHEGMAVAPVLRPRRGRFDSFLVEPGPPAIVTDAGILLVYNGANAGGESGDPRFPAATYALGQVLFDLSDPTAVLARCEQPFLFPEKDYETVGTTANALFANALAPLGDKWFLYYGTADSRIAVAVCG